MSPLEISVLIEYALNTLLLMVIYAVVDGIVNIELKKIPFKLRMLRHFAPITFIIAALMTYF